MQSIFASDGNVKFVILLHSNVDQFSKPINFSVNECETQNFQLESENKHIFRMDG